MGRGTARFDNGPRRVRGRDNPPISATKAPTCSALSARHAGPSRGVGAAVILPRANTAAMQLHVDEIAQHVAKGSTAIVLMDNAAWHKTKKLKWPNNVRPLFIPPGCAELNAAENIWQGLRQTYLSNRIYKTGSSRILVGENEDIMSFGAKHINGF